MQNINHCPDCGAATVQSIPDGDNRPRAICSGCGIIHYQNPNIVAGTLPVWEDKVLLCKRAIEPRAGYWTLPAGFMENEESLSEGAARETLEEATANVTDMQLYTVFSIPRISQVYMIFRANLEGENAFSPGIESLETALFTEDEIPWDDIAFRMIKRSLEYYYQDYHRGEFGLYVEDIE
ncbi:MAG: ADP-ribose pyrophosphatase YjhB (NUDIX family) [Saprospiraceae bacterium]|jgi:ADP-ribose pyrophosphatase YjhB (NUDIX family)